MGKVGVAILLASTAYGQVVERAFRLNNVAAVSTVPEIATAIKFVGQIKQLTVDEAAATIAIKGTPDEMALAEWLIPKLDVAARSNLGPEEYRVQGNGDDVVMVFELRHMADPRSIQEIITTLRAVADLKNVYMVNAPGIITLRGDAKQIASAKFLLSELDQPARQRQSATVKEFKTDGGQPETLLVYGLAHTDSPYAIQEIVTNIRTVLLAQRVYMVNAPRLLALGGSTVDAQMAEWLISKLDRPTPGNAGNEARIPGGNDDVVHVFYLRHGTTSQSAMTLLTAIHKTGRIMKAYWCSAPAAIVVRGTADEVAVAGRMIEASEQNVP